MFSSQLIKKNEIFRLKKRAITSIKTLSLFKEKKEGSDLLSHLSAVPSALKDFTSLFGMVKGVSPSLMPPTNLYSLFIPLAGICSFINIPEEKNLATIDFLKIENFRVISIAWLPNASLRFHLQPIYVIIFNVPSWNTHLEVGFVLRCFQRLSIPHIATLQCPRLDNRYTSGAFNPVLSY